MNHELSFISSKKSFSIQFEPISIWYDIEPNICMKIIPNNPSDDFEWLIDTWFDEDHIKLYNEGACDSVDIFIEGYEKETIDI